MQHTSDAQGRISLTAWKNTHDVDGRNLSRLIAYLISVMLLAVGVDEATKVRNSTRGRGTLVRRNEHIGLPTHAHRWPGGRWGDGQGR